MMNFPSTFDQLLLLTLAGVVYLACLTVYRLLFHPLSSYPGPKLTALTHWVECYHDLYQKGQFIFKIQEWHARYGPIIRINPDELHVDDYAFYETLYGGPGSKRDKYEPWCKLAGSLGSAFATPGHELHRLRRRAIQNFFSKASILKIEDLVASNVKKLERKFEQSASNGDILVVNFAYFALTMDVITQYAFDGQESLLDDDALAHRWHQTLHVAAESGAMARQFPWIVPVANALPTWMIGILNQPMKLALDWRQQARDHVRSILRQDKSSVKDGHHKTVFHELRDSDLPASEKGIERLVDEAQVFIGAGSETTARTLAVITYYLLTNKQALRKLQQELLNSRSPDKNDLTWTKLEQLPYLSAVVAEGLRLSYGITTRLPRVTSGEEIVYNGRCIPPGTPVGMTQYLIMTNPTIFPSPTDFRPERWLHEDGSYNTSMNKLVISFGKGSRQCVGINLAYAEMYLALATVFRKFDLKLYDTQRDDVEIARDSFTAVPRDGSKGVRVRVKRLHLSD